MPRQTRVLDDKFAATVKVDVAALTSQAFAAVAEKTAEVVLKPGITPEPVKIQPNAEHKAYLKSMMQELLTDLYYEPEALKYSAHLNRTELLYPLLQKLRQQARFNAMTKIVSVYGEVKLPGEYPLAENAGVEHLIAAAGGLNDSAYLEKGRIDPLTETK